MKEKQHRTAKKKGSRTYAFVSISLAVLMMLSVMAVPAGNDLEAAAVNDFRNNGFIYEILSEPSDDNNGTVMITRGPSVVGALIIPETVVDVATGNTYDVTTIGDYAFQGCTALTSVNLANVTTIEGYAFAGCTALTAFTVADVNTVYSVTDGVLYNKLATELLIYPAGKTATSFTVPNTVTTIREGAFAGCTALTSVDLANVTTIGYYAFAGCTALTAFTVADVNTVYSVTDGVLYNESATELLICPAGKTATSFTVPDTVTAIGGGAFYGCTALTSVDLANVTTIGWGAFYGCTALTSVDLANVTTIGNYAFAGCTALTSVDLANVTTIGDDAFQGCTALTAFIVADVNTAYSATDGVLYNKLATELLIYPAGKAGTEFIVPDTVTTIGWSAFYGCTALASADLTNVTTIGWSAFYGCTALASADLTNVTTIGDDAFEGCTALSSVDLANVTTIGDDAFEGCTALSSVDLANVTTVGWGAFYGCTALASVNFGSVTTIGAYAFQGCTALTAFIVADVNTVYSATDGVLYNKLATELLAYPAGKTATSFTVPNTVTTIREGAFAGCTALTAFTVADVNTVYSVKDGVLYNKLATELLIYPAGKTATSFTVPAGVTTIGEYAFEGCTTFTSVNFGNVTTIEGYAFYGCTALTSVNFANVTTIGYAVFRGCTALTSVDLANVTTIGDGAFQDCTGLTDLTLSGNSVSADLYQTGWTLHGMSTMLTSITVDGNMDVSLLTGAEGRSITFSSTATSTTGGSFYYSDGTTLVNDSDRAGKTFTYSEGKWILAPALTSDPSDPDVSDPDDGDNTMLYVGIAVVAVIAVAGIAFFLLRKP